MKVMAIDYGDAKTGLAVSDRSGTLVGDAWVIHTRKTDVLLEKIATEVKERQVEQIVLGYPKNMDGSLGPRAEKTQDFKSQLETVLDIPIGLWDERRTSVAADQILITLGKKGKKKQGLQDAVAASLILEGFLQSL